MARTTRPDRCRSRRIGWRSGLALAVLLLTPLAGAEAASVDLFPIPTGASQPSDIAVGPDGNLWFTEFATNRVGRVTPAGVVTEFTLPPGATGPLGLTFANNNFGFICASTSDQIIRFNPLAAGDAAIQSSFLVLGTAVAGSRPTDIVFNPTDGLIVFTLSGRDRIARLGTAGGVILETVVPGPGSAPAGIAVGPDGAIWFTQAGSDEIGRFTEAGTITNEFPVPGIGSDPRGIVSGPDGALWFTQFGSDEIGRITTGGEVTEFPLTPGARPLAIANGPSPRLSFTQMGRGSIGLITTAGAMSEVPLEAGALPSGITLGPDGNIWFTEQASNRVGRADISAPPLPPGGSEAVILAAVLPSSRSVQVGDTATAFATILNTGPATATGCGIFWPDSVPGTFEFRTTDPATNVAVGVPNQVVDIGPGAGQTFVFAFTPPAPLEPTLVALVFACDNTPPAPVLPGVSTLLFSASASPIPDIVALTATLANDGIVTVAPGTNVFAVASVNVGIADDITVSTDTGDVQLPLVIAICPTDAATGVCLTPAGPTVTVFYAEGATASFGVFVQAGAGVPFDPATNRIFVRFTDSASVVRGASSVAVRTP